MDVDTLQAKLGGMSRYQWLLVVTVSLLSWTELMNQTAVFFSAVPDHRCKVSKINANIQLQNVSEEAIKRIMIPFDEESQKYDSCHRYEYNKCENSTDCHLNLTRTVSCDDGYYYDRSIYLETTVSEWDMVCDRRILDTIAMVVYFTGIGAGSLFVGPLTDWLGRKLSMLVFTVNIVVFGILSTLVKSYKAYMFSRFMVGMTDNVYMTIFAYLVEIANSSSRQAVENYMLLFSSTSHIALPAIAFALRDWRDIGLVVSLVPSVFFVIYFIIPESPRWLLSVGREKEAKSFYAKCALSNNTELSEEDWANAIEYEREKRALTEKRKYSMLDLFRLKYMRVVTMNSMYCWFVIDILFEGLVLNVGTLAGNPYVNAGLNGAVEVLAYIVYAVVVTRLNKKRWFMCGFLVASGMCCIVSMLLFQYSDGVEEMLTASTVFAITGKFFASAAYAFSFIMTNELFPTIVRGTGMAAASLAARLGAMVMPFILLAQTDVPWLTQTILAVLALSAAATCVLFPDTSSLKILSEVEEAEKYYHEHMHVVRRLIT